MSFQPSPKQALFLFGMLFGQTDAEREPMQSKTRPELSAAERKQLVAAGLVELETRGRAKHLIAKDAAWEWAGAHLDSALSRTPHAQVVLQGVLRQLGKFLAARDLALADVAMAAPAPRASEPADAAVTEAGSVSDASVQPAAPAPPVEDDAAPGELGERIRRVVKELAGGAAKRRVRLAELRARLGEVPRSTLDTSLLELQDAGRLVLYPLDNPVELTPADRQAALLVGQNPRHVIYLES